MMVSRFCKCSQSHGTLYLTMITNSVPSCFNTMKSTQATNLWQIDKKRKDHRGSQRRLLLQHLDQCQGNTQGLGTWLRDWGHGSGTGGVAQGESPCLISLRSCFYYQTLNKIKSQREWWSDDSRKAESMDLKHVLKEKPRVLFADNTAILCSLNSHALEANRPLV